ncbi:MAG: MBL fold metallo-hydrolase [Saprospiraceae bacterium]|nr:MBL fold metallo-hydrolase [Saprospiraceae bacterium]
MNIKAFCFNPFYENTYILSNAEKEAWIIDPGCFDRDEQIEIETYLEDSNLQLTRLLLTHAHIDHILGLDYIFKKYGLKAELHKGEQEVLESASYVSQIYDVPFTPAPYSETYLVDNQVLDFGNEKLICVFTPGHSPASLSYYSKEHNFVSGGDVLFDGSIGRTDLPGGDFDTLISSIKTRLFPLGDQVMIYPGHGAATTIGQERLTNPFLN